MMVKLNLWRKGYRRVPPDMYWYSAFNLVRGLNPRKVVIYQRGYDDTILYSRGKTIHIHTINHDTIMDLDYNLGHMYLKRLAEVLRELV